MADDALLSKPEASGDGIALSTAASIVKEHLPSGVKSAADTAPLLAQCMAEYLRLLTTHANEQAGAEQKKSTSINTISEAHTAKAIEACGFGHHRAASSSSASSSQLPSSSDDALGPPDAAERKGKKRKLKKPAPELSEEELLRMQQELFSAARQKLQVPEGEPGESG